MPQMLRLLQDRARDSLENLLFSICRFKQFTGTPASLAHAFNPHASSLASILRAVVGGVRPACCSVVGRLEIYVLHTDTSVRPSLCAQVTIHLNSLSSATTSSDHVS